MLISQDYDLIVKQQLLEAVRKILLSIQNGKMSKFCLYVKFLREYSGVSFPPEITVEKTATIVLQNKFYNLRVEKDFFFVVVEFENQNYPIVVPFKSVILVADPTRDFYIDFTGEVLYYEDNEDDEQEEQEEHFKNDNNVIMVDFQKYDNKYNV